MNAVVFLAAVLATGPAQSVAPDPSLAESLVRRIETRHARTEDLVGRFVQSYRSGLLGRELVERGIVSIKRPGRMRWEYKDPEEKLFISDGETFYFYVPEDRQVIVQQQDEQRSLAARLLFGQGGLLESSTSSPTGSCGPSSWRTSRATGPSSASKSSGRTRACRMSSSASRSRPGST